MVPEKQYLGLFLDVHMHEHIRTCMPLHTCACPHSHPCSFTHTMHVHMCNHTYVSTYTLILQADPFKKHETMAKCPHRREHKVFYLLRGEGTRTGVMEGEVRKL